MASPVNSSPPPPATIHFPLTLAQASDDHDRDHDVNGKRKLIDEMDFFSDKKDVGGSAAGYGAEDRFSGPGHRSPSDFKVNTGLHLLTTANTGSDESIVDDGVSPDSELVKRSKNEMVLLQAEMERMNSENRRLRDMLNDVTNNYNGLKMHLVTLMHQQQQTHDQRQLEAVNAAAEEQKSSHDSGAHLVPRQFMDLGFAANNEDVSLSPSTTEGRAAGKLSPASPDKEVHEGGDHEPENKVAKHSHCPRSSSSADQAAEATMRKARVSVRARSEAPMITDGCQWRKYGQKIAKGNPWPRAYYRCTMAGGCPVRKQVQRCAEDTTILITTYEGNHNHPLPPAAMAMASTTSSAARMLLSGSMPSADGLMNSNFLARTLLPCSSSMATISASAPFPTITLDLTQSPNPLQFPRPPNQFSLPFLNGQQNMAGSSAASALLPQIFGQALYNQSKFSGLQMSSQEILEQSAHQMQQGQQSQLNYETVNALATDPNFTAALAAAISSFMGGSGPNNNNNNNGNNNNNNNNNNAATTSNNNGNNSSS